MLLERGGILSEYPPGTQPIGALFPPRNRIISGLCRATVVFEGAEKSGALITARYAKEQGRTVYALPGNVGSKTSQLSNLLIKNGAKICTSAEDVLNDFIDSYRGVINPFMLKESIKADMMKTLSEYGVVAVCPDDDIFSVPKSASAAKNARAKVNEAIAEEPGEMITPPANFDKSALKVYKRIPTEGSCSLESLVDSEMNLREVMKCLLKLEMGGFIVMLPGEAVSRKFK